MKDACSGSRNPGVTHTNPGADRSPRGQSKPNTVWKVVCVSGSPMNTCEAGVCGGGVWAFDFSPFQSWESILEIRAYESSSESGLLLVHPQGQWISESDSGWMPRLAVEGGD